MTFLSDRVEIHHPNGHITSVPVYLPEDKNKLRRMKKTEDFITEIIDAISPHLNSGTEVYLIIQSKANEQASL